MKTEKLEVLSFNIQKNGGITSKLKKKKKERSLIYNRLGGRKGNVFHVGHAIFKLTLRHPGENVRPYNMYILSAQSQCYCMTNMMLCYLIR